MITYRKLLILSLFALTVFGQPSSTTLVGPVYSAIGPALYTGTITISAQVKTSGGYAITGIAQQVSIVNGRLSVQLVPNDTAVPAGTSYAVTFINGDQWTCIVPTSGSPVPWTTACTPLAAASSPVTPIAVSQLIPSVNAGWCLQSSPSTAQWANCALVSFSTPASSSAACTQGNIEFDAAFIYVCVATNTWRRMATSSF